MNIEDKKIVAAQQYALERLGNVENILDLESAWLAGFEAQESVIQESIQTLEKLRDDINNLPLVEQMFKSRDLDRINNKIEVLQSLL